MGRENRNTLKEYFGEGALPTARHFADLVDSTLNMNDEGFTKTLKNGFEITAQDTSTGLIGFFHNNGASDPAWSVTFGDADRQQLTIRAGSTGGTEDSEDGQSTLPLVTLSPSGHVGINHGTPSNTLDVGGTICSVVRKGIVPNLQLGLDQENATEVIIPADGKWRNITQAMGGCHALEVVAGVGKKNTGRWALVHAIAINTFNPTGWFFNFLRLKNRIKCRQSYYRSRADKLALRWVGTEDEYYLQIRSNSDYGVDENGDPIRIKYHITELWDDFGMEASWKASPKS